MQRLTSVQMSRFSEVRAPTGMAFSLPANWMTFSICTSSSAAESSRPVLSASGTLKNLFLRTKTTWLCFAGSNFFAVSAGLVGYRLEWKLSGLMSATLLRDRPRRNTHSHSYDFIAKGAPRTFSGSSC